MIVTQTVDWLSATFKRTSADGFYGAAYPPHFVITGEFSKRGIQGYDKVFLYDDGRMECENLKRSDMGVHVIWSGNTIREIHHRYDMTPYDQFKWLYDRAKITRLDVALDVRESGLNIPELSALIKQGRAQISAKKALAVVDALGDGKTQYVGQKTASAYLKIYDKAAETGVVGDWVRIEATFQKKKAVPASNVFAQTNDAKGLILSVANFPTHTLWKEIFATNALSVKEDRQRPNTEVWLLGVVANTLANASRKNPDFLQEFNRRVEKLMKENT